MLLPPINVPFVHLVHDLMLAQHGGQAGLKRGANAIALLVASAPDPKARGAGRGAACEYAGHFLARIARDKPFRAQNATTAWVLAMYGLRRLGYAFEAQYGALPYHTLGALGAQPEAWDDDAIVTWLERGTQLAGARHRAA